MTRLLTFIFLFCFSCSSGQIGNNHDCRIEFYLLKTVRPNLDTTKNLQGEFFVTKSDLADTAFIKDFEVISYSISRDTTRGTHSQNIIEEHHTFKVSNATTQRINNLKIPLCCGRQFALVANGQIIYAGYFWNLRSSFGSDWITAFSYDTDIDIMRKLPDYDFATNQIDIRNNSLLFDCLNSTKRMAKK